MSRDCESMTVSQLIQELQNQDPDAMVLFAYNFGDHWRTTVAGEFNDVRPGVVEYSDYHRMFKVVEDEEECANTEPEGAVVILSWM